MTNDKNDLPSSLSALENARGQGDEWLFTTPSLQDRRQGLRDSLILRGDDWAAIEVAFADARMKLGFGPPPADRKVTVSPGYRAEVRKGDKGTEIRLVADCPPGGKPSSIEKHLTRFLPVGQAVRIAGLDEDLTVEALRFMKDGNVLVSATGPHGDRMAWLNEVEPIYEIKAIPLDWSSNPVDVLEGVAIRAGRDVDRERMDALRAYCEEKVESCPACHGLGTCGSCGGSGWMEPTTGDNMTISAFPLDITATLAGTYGATSEWPASATSPTDDTPIENSGVITVEESGTVHHLSVDRDQVVTLHGPWKRSPGMVQEDGSIMTSGGQPVTSGSVWITVSQLAAAKSHGWEAATKGVDDLVLVYR